MVAFLVTVHVLLSIFLILIILLQPGKGADLAGAFGGGGSQTVFGSRGATTLLHKLTVTFFVLFVLTSMALALMQAHPGSSLMRDDPTPLQRAVPGPAGVDPSSHPGPVTD
jgi:preprotein translocase subunit SecG